MELYTYEWLRPVSIDSLKVTAMPGDTLQQIGPDQYKLSMKHSPNGLKHSLNWPDRAVQNMFNKGQLKVIEVTGTKAETFDDNMPMVIHADRLDEKGDAIVERPKQTSIEVVKVLTPKDPNAKKTTTEVVMTVKKTADEAPRRKQSQESVLKIKKPGQDPANISGHSEVVKIAPKAAKAAPPAPERKPMAIRTVEGDTQPTQKVAKSVTRSLAPTVSDHLDDAAGERAVVDKLVKRVSRKRKAE